MPINSRSFISIVVILGVSGLAMTLFNDQTPDVAPKPVVSEPPPKQYAKLTDVSISNFADTQNSVGHIDIREINDGLLRFSWVERTRQGWRGNTRTYQAASAHLNDVEQFSSDQATSHAYYAKVANGDENNSMAIWIDGGLNCGQQIYNTRDTNHEGPAYPDNLVYARPYNRATGWGEVVCLNRVSGDSYDADIAYNTATGGFVATWVQWDGWVDRVFYREYDPANGWGQAKLIDAGRSDSLSASMHVSDHGDILVSWYALDTLTLGDDTVYYNVKPAGQPWRGAAHIADVKGLAVAPIVYYSAADNHFNVVWKQYNQQTNYNTLWSNLLDTQGASVDVGSVVAADKKEALYQFSHYEFSDGWESLNGSANWVATLWIQKQGYHSKLVLAKRDATQQNWQQGEVIYETKERVGFREVRVDDNGNILATWVQLHDDKEQLLAKVYDANKQLWSEVIHINRDIGSKVGETSLKFAPPPQKIVGMKASTFIIDGKAIVLWPENVDGLLSGHMAQFAIKNKGETL